jgi:phosphoribosylpyrophosphate synthetase
MHGELKLIAGNANPALAHEISEHLGIPLTAAEVGRFPDGEISVHIKETVRGPTSASSSRPAPQSTRISWNCC